ncbi:methylmalonyl-CoA mutase subunit beta [Dactylosporangium roseum]|uniref:methylmalonyl-CoA mutase n=1 Tax=Dactylosporangium roseum TaxID=47989 RepID=A0ABY5Z9P7_9ACTN|nr:methylmalonyl-CoA mutase subunit beta [Dactylosporangium roseum]UWZ38784.1 methylmalonyl-CoA mutase subunit beta [Dactylosporangium roseum]
MAQPPEAAEPPRAADQPNDAGQSNAGVRPTDAVRPDVAKRPNAAGQSSAAALSTAAPNTAALNTPEPNAAELNTADQPRAADQRQLVEPPQRPDLRLAADFPAADLREWQRLALGVLRKSGAAGDGTSSEAVDELLATVDYSGVRIKPLYTAADQAPAAGLPGHSPFIRGGRAANGPWDIRQRHADPDAKATREAVLADLENGATSIWLAGIAPADLPEALDGVQLNLAAVVLDNGAGTEAAAEIFLGLPGAEKLGNLGADPLGWQARTGEPADLGMLGRLARRAAAVGGGTTGNITTGNITTGSITAGSITAGNITAGNITAGNITAGNITTGNITAGLRVATVDATPYHDAGGSDAEELGFAAATGVAYLRALVDAGLSTGMALRQLEFRYAATADQFATIAKLRAARRIWARIAQVCEVPHLGAQVQHAVTSDAMMTSRDPWGNLLRTTIACFAAGVGGADAVTVQPFDARLGLPDGFSRRIARNTQSLLVEEANVARVLDPAGGSWYVESLTDALAHAAWDVFTEVERAGGMRAALDSGLVADRIEATWQRRADNLAHRRDPITGVSEFPLLEERRPQRAPAPLPPSGGLPRRWYAQSFELLRDAADAAGADGEPPTVTLVTLGPPSAHSARASFAANLFAAGGIKTVQSGLDGTAGQPAGATAKPDSTTGQPAGATAKVVCICGSDRSYQEQAAVAARRLKEQGVQKVWLAGRPPKGGDDEAGGAGYDGVDDYLYAGCDALRVLRQTHEDLGVRDLRVRDLGMRDLGGTAQ